MVAKISEFLKQYITTEGIPIKQVLTPEDLNQLAVSLYHITKPKESKDFEAISNGIFKSSGVNTCFMYFRTLHDLPVEKIMSVVNHYITQHIVNNEDSKEALTGFEGVFTIEEIRGLINHAGVIRRNGWDINAFYKKHVIDEIESRRSRKRMASK